jgi:hypothetical protein
MVVVALTPPTNSASNTISMTIQGITATNAAQDVFDGIHAIQSGIRKLFWTQDCKYCFLRPLPPGARHGRVGWFV